MIVKMRELFSICLLVMSVMTLADDCVFEKDGKTIPLHGKVQIVESFPDIKVQIVDAFADVDIKIVSSFPDDCGEIQLVESFPDVKVQIVESFPDIKVRIVDSFPGTTSLYENKQSNNEKK